MWCLSKHTLDTVCLLTTYVDCLGPTLRDCVVVAFPNPSVLWRDLSLIHGKEKVNSDHGISLLGQTFGVMASAKPPLMAL